MNIVRISLMLCSVVTLNICAGESEKIFKAISNKELTVYTHILTERFPNGIPAELHGVSILRTLQGSDARSSFDKIRFLTEKMGVKLDCPAVKDAQTSLLSVATVRAIEEGDFSDMVTLLLCGADPFYKVPTTGGVTTIEMASAVAAISRKHSDAALATLLRLASKDKVMEDLASKGVKIFSMLSKHLNKDK